MLAGDVETGKSISATISTRLLVLGVCPKLPTYPPKVLCVCLAQKGTRGRIICFRSLRIAISTVEWYINL